jgi:hypothetical protein
MKRHHAEVALLQSANVSESHADASVQSAKKKMTARKMKFLFRPGMGAKHKSVKRRMSAIAMEEEGLCVCVCVCVCV